MTGSVTVLRPAVGAAWRAQWPAVVAAAVRPEFCLDVFYPGQVTLCSSGRRAQSQVARALVGVAIGYATRTPRSSANAARGSPSAGGSGSRAAEADRGSK